MAGPIGSGLGEARRRRGALADIKPLSWWIAERMRRVLADAQHDFWCQVAIVALCQALRDIDNALVESYEDGLTASLHAARWVKPK